MYEYENPGKDSSLVIINQNADWLIEALTQVSKNNGEAKAYLAGKDGTFFSHEDMGEAKEVDLLNECMEKSAMENCRILTEIIWQEMNQVLSPIYA